MASMSYCLFENTLSDLDRCVEKMGNAQTLDELDLNEYEQRCFDSLWRTCREFLAESERLLNAEINGV